MKLKYTVEYQSIGCEKPADLASDSQKYLSGEVSFGARWEDIISKWLVFEKGEQAYKAVLTDDKFGESLNLSLSSGMWLVSAHGVNEAGKQIDTTPCRLHVQQAGGIDGDAPLVVPLTEAEQILITADSALEKANEALALANDEQNTAAQAAAEAEASAAAALLSEQGASTAQIASETAAGYSQASAANAESSADDAAESAAQAALSVLGGGYVGFEIGDDGQLYCTRTTNLADTLNFALNEDGALEVTISG